MLLASDAERTRENCWCLTAVAYYLQPIWEHHLLDDSSGTLRCAVSFWGKITFFHLLCELAQFIKWTIHKDRITFPSVNALLLPKKARRRKKIVTITLAFVDLIFEPFLPPTQATLQGECHDEKLNWFHQKRAYLCCDQTLWDRHRNSYGFARSASLVSPPARAYTIMQKVVKPLENTQKS